MKVGNSSGLNPWAAFTVTENLADAGLIYSGMANPTDSMVGHVETGSAIVHGIAAVVAAFAGGFQDSPALWTQSASEALKCGGATVMTCGAPVAGALIYGSGIVGSLLTNFIDK